jgi:DNA-directed RNA polymerase beta subunit
MEQIPEIIPSGVELHRFDDVGHWRKDIFDKTVSALASAFPREYGGVRMELSDLKLQEKPITPDDERKARLNKTKLFLPIKGTVTLKDSQTGELLDKVKNRTILSVPYLTDRGTFVHGGSHYSSIRQARLLPGAYTRVKNNGELEAHYNVKPGTGNSFRVTFEPETAVFRMNIAGSNLKLYPVLKSMGVSDETLRQSWGDTVFEANQQNVNPRDINKLYNKLYRWDADENLDQQTKAAKIRERLESGILLRSTLRQTIGDPEPKEANALLTRVRKLAGLVIDNSDERTLAVDDILRGSTKLVAINRGDATPDERDALYFKKVYSTGDLIAERIKIDSDKPARTIMRKLGKRRKLDYLPPNFLNSYTEGHLVGNPLSSPTEETNPILLNEQLYRITQMGPGGIGSESAITEEMQTVSPSEFGFIDVLAGPESSRAGIDVRATYDSRLGSDGRIYQKFYNPKLKQYEWKSAYDLIGRGVWFGQ